LTKSFPDRRTWTIFEWRTRVADTEVGAADRPRVLVLAESLPYPTLKGGDHRNWQNVNVLAAVAHVGVFGLCSNDRRRDRRPDVPLELWTTATDPAVAYPPPTGMKLAGRAWLFDPQGHPSDLYFSDAAAREIASVLDSFRPDIVVVEGLWLQRYLETVRDSGCFVIFDAHNVEAALVRELAHTNERQDLEGRLIRDVLPARTEMIERRALHAADQIWVCSDEDARRLTGMYDPIAPVLVVPNGVRPDDFQQNAACRDTASLTLLFTGFFAHAPNTVAAAFLIDEILPRLAATCEAWRLLLVGGMPSAGMLAAAAADARIVVTGAVADVRPWLASATVVTVPLFHGSGTRFKILEAFAAGRPVISTAKGAEGLGARHGEHLMIAESADAFVDAALAIWQDSALADRLTAGGRELLIERFSWQAISSRIHDAVNLLGVA
jgi:polysaccharide biosynthesis protein PslH